MDQKSDDALFNPINNEDEDGMKANILYESAGPYQPENQQDDGASGNTQYAVVEKKKNIVGVEYAEVIPKKDRKGKLGNGDLYAEVQKNGKKKKEMGKRTKKVEKEKKKQIQKSSEEQAQGKCIIILHSSQWTRENPDADSPENTHNSDGNVREWISVNVIYTH
ncbi:uncharacterized protein [Argopecten irradians]|uniref:uncharacterized protein n=1 Tax=Argopecten irradians TaxID=31199 RepID=UPI0037191141